MRFRGQNPLKADGSSLRTGVDLFRRWELPNGFVADGVDLPTGQVSLTVDEEHDAGVVLAVAKVSRHWGTGQHRGQRGGGIHRKG
jgi:hypothetical protein